MLAIPDAGSYNVRSNLIFGCRPAPDRAVRPVLHYLSVQCELVLQWIFIGIHELHRPGDCRTGLLGAELVRPEIDDNRLFVGRQPNELRVPLIVKSILISVFAVSDLNIY